MGRKKRYSRFITPELNAGLKALREHDGIAEAEAIRQAPAAHLAERGVLSGGSTLSEAAPACWTRRKA
jgi:hypothetical protein